MSVCVWVCFLFFRVLRSVLFYLFVVLVVFAYLDVVWRRAVVVTWLAGLFVCFCCRSRQNTPPTVSLTRYQQEKESEKSRQWNWIKFVCIIRAWIFVTESIYICYTYECMSFTHAQVLSFACFFFFSFRSVFRPRRRLRRCLFYTSITLVFVDVVVGAILLSNSALYKSYTTPSMHRVVGGSFVCICWGSVEMDQCVFMYVSVAFLLILRLCVFSQLSIRGSWFLKIQLCYSFVGWFFVFDLNVFF